MKKVYNSPEMNVLFVETKDVITVSVGTEGVIDSFSFKDILDRQAGWN